MSSLGLEKCIFHAMDSQTNWKIWAVVETKLPETLSLFFFPSFHNLYFRTQHHLIKIYLNKMLIKNARRCCVLKEMEVIIVIYSDTETDTGGQLGHLL